MSKGQTRERQAAEIYEAAGYETYRPETSMYGDNDVFGLFDMLAFNGDELRMVQVKSNRAAGIESWRERAVEYALLRPVFVDFLVCHDREGWRLIQPLTDGHRTVYDERKEWDGSMGRGLEEWLRTECERLQANAQKEDSGEIHE